MLGKVLIKFVHNPHCKSPIYSYPIIYLFNAENDVTMAGLKH